MSDFEMPTLMMVSHGNSGNGGDPAGDLARSVAPDWNGPVTHGYMRSQPSLPEQLDGLVHAGNAERLIVFPLFFSEGYLVFEELPRDLERAGLGDAVILPPALNLPGFDDLVAQKAMVAMARRGWASGETSVFLVPHGLKTLTEALPETVRFGDQVGRLCGGAEICIGNIEGDPSLADWRTIASRKKAVIVPMLAGGGTHARQDLPELINARAGEEIEILPPVGQWAELSDLVLAEAKRHVARFGGLAVPLGPTGGDIWAERMARSA
ncbi:sirohydrochlorin chelatase [Thalassospira profundimaris]|uniref:Cobalamin biosynthesis protein CbiX n=1 Tax=Thalassospira profundimaris TaxID=502049 RepID=A0A367X8U9_9PROT|nr:CbiX/SirB N-terminal domain-containing protein [Thalassospira profundimaris]RCK49221.1 cobalamin biosynthesis protein CbiX [Thalassospira profundimaris]